MDGTPVLVVGQGIAGMQVALTVAQADCPVWLISKTPWTQSNTYLAQGGVAVALGPDDDPTWHAQDTVVVGRGLSHDAVVEILVHEAPSVVRSFLDQGLFGGTADAPDLGQEAGHSRPRILHSPGGATGQALARTMHEAVRACSQIHRVEGQVVSLAMVDGRCCGVWIKTPSNLLEWIPSRDVVLATGGYGGLFGFSSNPPTTSGDGIGLAWEAGAELADLEFVQFHPTVLAIPGERPALLLSEALRGFGAHLLDSDGRRILERYPGQELAPRDEVAREIWCHVETRGPVFLSLRHLDAQDVYARFGTLASFLSERGLDLAHDRLPVQPGAHFTMGGIVTDPDGRTTVPGLWAVGECSRVGIHGANRLASNSLLEGLVFGRRLAAALLRGTSPAEQVYHDVPDLPTPMSATIPAWLPDALDADFGVCRTGERLQQLRDRVRAAVRLDGPTLALTVIELAVEAALIRTESRGGHWRQDYPANDLRWQGHLVHQRGQKIRLETLTRKGGAFNESRPLATRG